MVDKKKLVEFSRQVLENYVKGKDLPTTPDSEEKRGLFVTLKKGGKLRGCIGFVEPLPLAGGVKKATLSAANDPRFLPVREEELDKIKIEISLLSKPVRTKQQEIIPGKDGVILEKDGKSGLFLPSVWEELPAKNGFMENLCYKAGLDRKAWKHKNTKLYKFEVEKIEDDKNGKYIE